MACSNGSFGRHDVGAGRPIDAFNGVNFVILKVARLTTDTRVSCVYLGLDGIIPESEVPNPVEVMPPIETIPQSRTVVGHLV